MRGKQEQVLKFKIPVSSKWSDPSFGALIFDDRSKQVELIREVEGLKDAYSPKLKAGLTGQNSAVTLQTPCFAPNSKNELSASLSEYSQTPKKKLSIKKSLKSE